MNILVAPDSFKGSVSAADAAFAIKKGIYSVYSHANVFTIPLADGGEGTMNSIINEKNGDFFYSNVKNPLGKKINSKYGILRSENTAVIELASSSGMELLTKEELDSRVTSTYGSGQLILDALNRGCRSFIICLGGSATNDGGSGLLKALGFKFLDKNNKELPEGGLALKNLIKIDYSNIDSRLKESNFKIACDVNAPLVGNQGASLTFGIQKGATYKTAKQLDEALINFANVIQKDTGVKIHHMPGSGAAGGTAGGLYALLNASLELGIETVIKALDFERILSKEKIHLILTGEGEVDSQTSSGKVVLGVSKIAKKYDIPVVALTGILGNDILLLYKNGLTACFCIADEPMEIIESMEKASLLLEKQAEQVIRLFNHKKT